MARARTIQQRFTHGEFDPLMIGRTDVDQYYGAAETLTNVLTIPQGGVTRRPGLEHIDQVLKQITRETSPTITAPNGGTTGNANDDNSGTQLTTTTNVGTTDPYVVVKYDLGSAKDVGTVRVDGLRLTVSGTSDEFFIQYSTDDVSYTSAGEALSLSTTAKDYSRRVHESVRYIRLARIGTTDLSTNKVELNEFQVWAEGADSNTRLLNFEFSKSQSYIMVLSDKNLAVYRNGVYQIDLRIDEYTSSVIPDTNWTQSLDTLLLFNPEVPVKQVQRNGADDAWTEADVTFDFIPQFDFVPGTSSPSGTITPDKVEGNVTITASGTPFTAGSVNQYIEGNAGRLRITEFVSSSSVKGVTEIPFFDTNAIASGSWSLLTGYEDVWSSTRGYPVSGTFYEGRLVLGGSRDRPNTVWLSRVADFFDFDPGQLLDDDAIEFTIDSDQLDEIVNVYPGRALMIFTTGAEYIILQSLGDPITPANVNVKRQTRVGSEANLRPQEFEGGVMYVQRLGQSIQEFVFDDSQDAFSNNFISLLSSHLVRTPVDIALRQASSADEGTYLLLVRDNGNLSVANILRSQNITSFTEATTEGDFKNCGVDVDTMYFVIERTIDGVTCRWLERFNNDHYMDASTRITTGLPTDTFTGLNHLEGEEVRVRADDSVLDSVTVTDGSITIEREATTYMECGINFNPTIKDLPVEVPDIGTAQGMRANISDVTLRVYQTNGILVNGQRVYSRGFGPAGAGSPLDTPPPEETGILKKRGFRGYDRTGQVTITQVDPLPMTILSLVKRVRVSG